MGLTCLVVLLLTYSIYSIYVTVSLLCAQANSASYPQWDGKWVVAYGLRGEGLVWLIGAVVYLSCQSAATSEIVKRCCSSLCKLRYSKYSDLCLFTFYSIKRFNVTFVVIKSIKHSSCIYLQWWSQVCSLLCGRVDNGLVLWEKTFVDLSIWFGLVRGKNADID